MSTEGITKNRIIYLLAQLDQRIANQTALILQTVEVQSLLSRWIELSLLCQASNFKNITLKLLDLQWPEIEKDLNTNLDLDSSVLFDHIYEQELGIAGGEPFSLLLANYELDLRKINVVSTLSRLGELGAYALAPILTNVGAQTFDLASYSVPIDFAKELEVTDLRAWQRARQSPQFRFINLVLPMIHLTPTNTILGSAALLALRIIRSFQETDWFTEILGPFVLDDLIDNKDQYSVNCNVFLKSHEEQKLCNSGFITLMQNSKHQPLYFGNTYCAYQGQEVPGLLLEHILCACRFGQHIKILARQKIGSHADEQECEKFISAWLKNYTATIKDRELRARYPLQNFNIKLAKIPGKIGYYHCQILLEPHMKLENMNTQIILHSEILTP